MNFKLKKTRDYFRKPDYLLENIDDNLFASGFLDKMIRIKTHSSKIFITGHPMELFSLKSPELFVVVVVVVVVFTLHAFLIWNFKIITAGFPNFPIFPYFPY